MKSISILIPLSWIIFLASGCVTTRSEMNERRQQGVDSSVEEPAHRNSVVSEDLSGNAPAPSTDHSPSGVSHADTAPVNSAPVSQYGMEEMRAELAKLSGKVEEMEQEKRNQQASQTEDQNKLQQKIAELEKQLKEREEKEKGPAVPEGKNAFQVAKDAFHSKQYEKAIQYFDVDLKNDESSSNAEEAYFLRGESYFQLKQYKKAIVDYSKFPEKFPKSKYHSKALLKIAQCFESLGMKDDAKAFYQDLAERFPKTVEGKLAKKKVSGKTSKK